MEAMLVDARIRSHVDLPVGTPIVPASFEAQSGGETALHLAASHTYTFHHTQHVRIARALLAAGANPNLTTASGRTAVHCACDAGNAAVLRELVACGRVASWSARDGSGRTPRDCARGDPALLALLPRDDVQRRDADTR